MRILHLTTELPIHPGGTGGATRQFRLLGALAALGHDVTVVAPMTRAQQSQWEPAGRLAEIGVRLLATPRYETREREVLAAVRRDPRGTARTLCQPAYVAQTSLLRAGTGRAAQHALAHEPDIATVEHDFAVGMRADLPADVPVVLMTQNVTADYYRSRAQSSVTWKRWLLGVDARRYDCYVDPRLSEYAHIVAVSERDANAFRRRTAVPVSVVPNGTDIGAPLPQAQGRPTVLFTGTLSHPPNREGILWFHRHVWPLIRHQVANVRLVIVGRSPPADVARLATGDAAVEVFGDVPSMEPFVREATVVVAPLHAGGGTRLKILDAFSAQRAVVSTTVGAEGLEVRAGRDLLLGDTAMEFAALTTLVLTDRARRTGLAAAGREVAVERYAWPALARSLGDILERVKR